MSIHDALEAAGHSVIPVGIDRSGSWFVADSGVRPFRAEGREVDFVLPSGALVVGDEAVQADVIFPVLHGPRGEDGTVQGMFEVAGLPYVGCGVRGSAVAMDKHLAKTVVSAAGIATPRWIKIDRHRWTGDGSLIERIVSELSLPVFIKPVGQGSSIGIAKASSNEDVRSAVINAFRYDDTVIVEELVHGREIEVAVLDGPRASVPGEVVLAGGWYTYDAKYADATSQFVTPADLAEGQSRRVAHLAEEVFDHLGLNGLARIDFFLDESSGQFLFNEANTMPGFTSISGFPKMWEASGVSYPELCNHLVLAAIDRHATQAKLSTR